MLELCIYRSFGVYTVLFHLTIVFTKINSLVCITSKNCAILENCDRWGFVLTVQAAPILEAGGTEEEAISGLLHDAVEDQGGKSTREEICQRFGETVVAIVDGCTESDTHPKPPWQERKQRYLENLRHASASVRRVSLADKLHNARSLLADLRQHGSSIWQQFKTGREGTLWFYQQLQQVYSATGSDFLAQEFSRVVQELCNES